MSREHRNNTLVEPTGNVSASAPSDNNSATYEDVVHTHTCLVCDETKSLTGFPNVLHVSSHDHNNDVCSVCYARHLEIEVASKVWNQISCPQCPMILQKEDIRVLADFETSQMYERFAYRAALLQNPAYRHCFSTSCNSGQAHDGSLVFSCQACGHRGCTACDVNWHHGETCEEYQNRNQTRKQQEADSEREAKLFSKTCPHCNSRIMKLEGCDHMTCSCAVISSAGPLWQTMYLLLSTASFITNQAAVIIQRAASHTKQRALACGIYLIPT